MSKTDLVQVFCLNKECLFVKKLKFYLKNLFGGYEKMSLSQIVHFLYSIFHENKQMQNFWLSTS